MAYEEKPGEAAELFEKLNFHISQEMTGEFTCTECSLSSRVPLESPNFRGRMRASSPFSLEFSKISFSCM